MDAKIILTIAPVLNPFDFLLFFLKINTSVSFSGSKTTLVFSLLSKIISRISESIIDNELCKSYLIFSVILQIKL